MKLLPAASVLCLVLAFLWLQETEGLVDSQTSTCCFTFLKAKIGQSKIQCYRNVSSSCNRRDGVIFRLKSGKEFCASREHHWVSSYMRKVKDCLGRKQEQVSLHA